MPAVDRVRPAAEPVVSPLRTGRGFSLIEVLIALAVLTVGLLGLAALQSVGLRIGHEPYERTQATMLVYEMVDRMRANPAGVAGGYYTLAMTGIPPAAPTDCTAAVCTTAAEMAAYDLNQWISTISGATSAYNPGINRPALAGGRGAVTAAGENLYDVSVEWTEQAITMNQTVRVRLP